MAIGDLTSSVFLSCTPRATQSTYTTTYTTTLAVTCSETKLCSATYTVEEVCTGDAKDYVTPTVPPNFVVETHVCPGHCDDYDTVLITCPASSPTANAYVHAEHVTLAACDTCSHHQGGDSVDGADAAAPEENGSEGDSAGSDSMPPPMGDAKNSAGGYDSGAAMPAAAEDASDASSPDSSMGDGPVLVGSAPTVERAVTVLSGLALIVGALFI